MKTSNKKRLQTVIFLFSPFFFSLSFSLTWFKVSKPPDWGVQQCSFNKFNYWSNRTFTVSLFWIHTTFQHLRFGQEKRFGLYLSLTGFQFPDFLSFYGRVSFSGAGWSQQSCCNAWFVQTSDFTLFTCELSFPGVGWIQHVVLTLTLSKLKILLKISLMRAGLFGAKILSTNHSTFPLSPPCRITLPNWPWLL